MRSPFEREGTWRYLDKKILQFSVNREILDPYDQEAYMKSMKK
jgi:hypothetical protein